MIPIWKSPSWDLERVKLKPQLLFFQTFHPRIANANQKNGSTNRLPFHSITEVAGTVVSFVASGFLGSHMFSLSIFEFIFIFENYEEYAPLIKFIFLIIFILPPL